MNELFHVLTLRRTQGRTKGRIFFRMAMFRPTVTFRWTETHVHKWIRKLKSNRDWFPIDRFGSSSSSANLIRAPSTADDEQKLVYKRVSSGGDIPSTGLQKFSQNHQGKPWFNYRAIRCLLDRNVRNEIRRTRALNINQPCNCIMKREIERQRTKIVLPSFVHVRLSYPIDMT